MIPDTGLEYLALIIDAIKNAPRSLQTKIGPSEIGSPCARKIGYKRLNHPEHESKPNWKATVGTACHSWLENTFDQVNLRYAETHEGVERFMIETKVEVGEVDGETITGSCDLFDLEYGVVTDWKTCGPSMLAKYRSVGPGDQYRSQAHLYGRGWQRAGYRVNRVQIVFLPRNGDLADTFVWSEAYDEKIAITALDRLQGITVAVKTLGYGALSILPTAPVYCHLCPYYVGRSDDLAIGCPGDQDANANQVPDTADAVLGLKG